MEYMNLIYGMLGLIIGFLVPIIYSWYKEKIPFVENKLGVKKYNECKQFLIILAKMHPEDFAEDKLADLLDIIDNRFGNHLSKVQIKEIIDFVIKTIIIDISKGSIK